MGHQRPTATFTQTDATVSQQSLYIAATTSIQLSTTKHKAHSYRNSRKKTNKGNIYHMTGRTHVPRCSCYVTIHFKSNFVIFTLCHVNMIFHRCFNFCRSPERFECGRFSVAKNTAKSKTNFCGTGPYSYERVKEIKVAIGPDGTNGLTSCSNSNFHQSQHSSDDVRAEFCSDVDSVCCRTKLSTLLHDDWSKNDDEQWGESDLGPCKTTLYKVGLDSDWSDWLINVLMLSPFQCMTTYCQLQVRNGIRFTLLKNGNEEIAREEFHHLSFQERTTCR